MIILYEHHLKQIEQICDEMPMKYGKQLIGLLAHIRNEQIKAQAEVAKAEAEKAPETKAE
jgi:ABC-type uncharacterized transport system ATPase subunit